MQGGRKEEAYRRVYDDAMDGVADILVQKVKTRAFFPYDRGGTYYMYVESHFFFRCGS